MVKLADQEGSPNGANGRLVLGFDAGCMTCSELARRIEEQVGDKLEIRSLRDPQVGEWRRRSLGEDAPWAPTLIEVKDLKVRAWTGKRMGIHLSRSLGPIATWRVMQVLGELGAAAASERLEDSPMGVLVGSMSRAQFFKGMGGAIVAMSILSGAGPLASVAAAKGSSTTSTGTPADRNKALAIVRSSIQFKDLASEQRHALGRPGNGYGSEFDPKKSIVKVSGKDAVVGVVSSSSKRGVAAVFYVDLNRKKVTSYSSLAAIPKGNGAYDVTFSLDGKIQQRVTATADYVITASGQKLSYQQYKQELQKSSSQGSKSSAQTVKAQDAVTDCIGPCLDDCLNSGSYQEFCSYAAQVAGQVGTTLFPEIALFGDLYEAYLEYLSGGCDNYAETRCYGECACYCSDNSPDYGC